MTIPSGTHKLQEAVPEAERVILSEEREWSSARQTSVTLTHTHAHSYYSPCDLGIGPCNFYVSESEMISKVGYFLGMISGMFSIF